MKNLFDDCSDERKIHTVLIPNIGGAAIIMAFIIAYSTHPVSPALKGFEIFVACSIIILCIGLKDDLLVIDPFKKLLGQVIVASLMVFGADVTVNNFGGVFGLYEIPAWLSIAVSLAFYVGLINALNLIDGIDGLAASITTFASLVFAYWFYIAGHTPLFVFSLLLAACYGSFLWYNWSPARVFMGDTGSIFAGFMLAFLGIHFLNTGLSSPVLVSWQPAIPVVLVAIIVIPLYDTLRVFILRILNGGSPFEPDNNHVHHHFIQNGLSHSESTSVLLMINIVIVATSMILAPYLGINYLLLVVIAMTLALLPTVQIKRKMIYRFAVNFFGKRLINHFPEPFLGNMNGNSDAGKPAAGKKNEKDSEELFEVIIK